MTTPAWEPEAVSNDVPQPVVEGHSNRKYGHHQQRTEATEVSSNNTAKLIAALEGLQSQGDGERRGQEVLFLCNQIKYSLNQGVDVNTPNHEGVAAIIIVTKAFIQSLFPADAKAVQCCMEIIRQLFDRGADLDVQDRDGRTALVLAIEAQRPSRGGTVDCMDEFLIDLLIEEGASLDPPSQCERPWPNTPLIAAISRKRLETVKLLLSKKANANTCVGGLNGMYAAVRDGGEMFPERLSATVSTTALLWRRYQERWTEDFSNGHISYT
jgi:ankyrin repeat protein